MIDILAAAPARAFGVGLVATTFAFGLRHGIDWDHIAAITDISTSQETSRTSMVFATLYALGHAAVVFVLGLVAITLGDLLPASFDQVMERIVGVTLLILGVYVFYALVRHGRDFRMRSRWMLIFSGVRRGSRWARERLRSSTASSGPGPAPDLGPDDVVEHEHEHVAGTPHHAVAESPAEAVRGLKVGSHGHGHRHQHGGAEDPFMDYGKGTSFLVGMIHGVGAETPSQVLIFVAAAGAGGPLVGTVLLLVFLAGLLASNTGIALASTYGFLAAGRSFAIYVSVALVTGTFSLIVGSLFLFGKGTLLPALFGG